MGDEAYKKAHINRDPDLTRELKFPEELKNTVPLSISEVNLLLERRLRAKKQSKTEDVKPFGEVFLFAIDYCRQFGKLKNDFANERVRFLLESQKFAEPLHKFEVVSLIDLCPKTPEEAFELIPSLQERFSKEEVQVFVNYVLSTVAFSSSIKPEVKTEPLES